MTGRRRSVFDVLRSAAPIVLAVWCVASPAFAQQTPRDRRKPLGVGTAAITGVILLDDAQPKPLRRARVTLNGPELTVGRTIITNDDGTFAIDRLPAGRYTVGAVKDGYVAMNYGARRPGRGGTGIVLGDGETRSIALRLPRGGVITGTVTDADGQPASGVFINALSYRYVAAGGERRLGPAGLSASATDDRGVYRLFGLPAGDYLVAAQLRSGGSTTGDLQVLSQSEIRRALAEVGAATTRAQPGSPPPFTPAAPTFNEPRRNVTLAPVFYPGTSDAGNATTITIAAGEERGGVDFQLQYVPTAAVSGIVSTPPGAMPPSVNIVRSGEALPGVQSFRSTRTDADGRFMGGGMMPGKYTVLARSSIQAPRTGAEPGAQVSLWAATEIIVDGQDISGIGLTLQPGLTIAGRVVFEGTRPRPPDLSTLRVTAPPAQSIANLLMPLPPVQLESGGRFTVSGIVPGPYRFLRGMQGVRAPLGGWWLKSILINGREVLDAELDLRQSANDAVVTFSDRATELSGRVTDSPGIPTPEHFVIVFAADRTSWFLNSRRIAGVQPDREGRYTIRNLPPGDYLVAATDDVEPNEWYDPSVLERLARSASRITIGEYEMKTYDIRIP